jgi:L-asparaginase/Glu-tRNA(Gln) amidotransferase subunit D
MKAAVTKPAAQVRKSAQLLAKILIIGTPGTIAYSRSISAKHLTRPPFAHPMKNLHYPT